MVRKLDDTEGPHQLRVGLRRLRSAFLVYKSALESPEMARLSGEAKWLGQEVGGLRDLDVVANDIVGGRLRSIRTSRVCRLSRKRSHDRPANGAITYAHS